MNKTRAAAILGAATSLVVAAGIGPAGAVTGTNAQSQIMAGYEVGGGRARLVSTRTVLPNFTCGSDSNVALFVALSKVGFATATSSSPPPKKFAVVGVEQSCSSGVLSYSPLFLINGVLGFGVSLSLSPGDAVELSARQTAKGAIVTIKDFTTKMSTSYTGLSGGNGARDSVADIGVLEPPGPAAPAFGAIHFVNNEVNGITLGDGPMVAYDYFNGTSVTMQTGRYNTAHNRFEITTP